MEMHQIRYFLAVCEAENFTRAAEQCHVSQPALTTAIKKLEEEFGGALFHRRRGRATLTELGELTRPYIEQVQGQAEAARSVADSFRLLKQAPLNVGVMATIGPLCLASFLARFQRDYPGVEVELHEGALEPLCRRCQIKESRTANPVTDESQAASCCHSANAVARLSLKSCRL